MFIIIVKLTEDYEKKMKEGLQMDQSAKYMTMKDKLQMAADGSDHPTITYQTPKAFTFYVSATITVISMFLNWLSLDIDLGYFRLEEVLGTVNLFTLPGSMGDIKDVLSPYGMFLPEGLMSGLSTAQFVGIVLMVAACAAIACYIYAIFLRIKEDDNCAKFGKLAAMVTIAVFVGFVVLISASLSAIDAAAAMSQIMTKILTGAGAITLVGAIVTLCCANMNIGFKEDVVIYHNGIIKIDKGPKWRCKSCRKKNLSRLERCYYCGMKKE